MTSTINEQDTTPVAGAVGRVARVKGSVVDIEFPENQMPAI